MEEKKHLIIQVPDCIVRNETSKMDANTFAAYTYLKFLHFRNYNDDILKIDHNKFKHKLYISDNRTLKKAFTTLHKQGYILEYINKLPTKGALTFTFEPMPLDDLTFTQLPVTIFNFMEHIGTVGLRLLFYYESFINRQDDPSKQFAFPAIETTSKSLGINKDTIIKYHDILIKHNLLKVTKHKIEHSGEYNEWDEPIFTKYNNHYYVNLNKILNK
ncbi:hypothetical protein V7128_01990 [Neobacillus vireti]|uniref:hypothetical protein n=1 Tax=Neobacillus vireti TaxID=220686 RepID=UPI002FFF0E0E